MIIWLVWWFWSDFLVPNIPTQPLIEFVSYLSWEPFFVLSKLLWIVSLFFSNSTSYFLNKAIPKSKQFSLPYVECHTHSTTINNGGKLFANVASFMSFTCKTIGIFFELLKTQSHIKLPCFIFLLPFLKTLFAHSAKCGQEELGASCWKLFQ